MEAESEVQNIWKCSSAQDTASTASSVPNLVNMLLKVRLLFRYNLYWQKRFVQTIQWGCNWHLL